jgi:hypothetical protein
MSLWVVDIETKGLDARKFVTACIMKENGTKVHFDNKNKLWEYIIENGKKESQRSRILNVYAHNHEFDFYGYADLNDKNIKFFCFRPFIASYEVNGNKLVNFLDSYAIFKMSLKSLGEMIGLEKLDTPEEFLNAERITKKRIKELRPYVERDVEIVMKAMKLMKEKIALEEVSIRRLYTISQIAIAYLINILKKDDRWDKLFWNKKYGILHKSRYKELIHGAYRGGRVECFKLGEHKPVDYLDINNLYGHASMNIRFPNLNTERYIQKPLEKFDVNEILSHIGICRVMIYNRSNKIGLLPVRTGTGNYYPKEDTYLIGTYTNLEIEEAIKEGYELIDIEWAMVWDEMDNPFKEITRKLYELRKGEKSNAFNNFFYKEMQNRSYGKLAQRKSGYEIVIDSVENAKKYLADNWEIMNSKNYNYIYVKEKEEYEKSYYAPIIPTQINAWARVYMYRQFKKVPFKDLVYTDTDSLIMKSGNKNKVEIGEKIGLFKVENEREEIIINGKKTYAIGDEIKVSGFRKSDITIEDFKKGHIKSMKMNTLKSSANLEDVGSFSEETRDLDIQLKESKEIAGIYFKEKVFKDNDIKDINHFIKKIGEIV